MALLFAKNNSLSAVTALPASVSGGGLNLISTQTASSSSTIDFTSGIDSTYKEYVFKFYDVHPSSDNVYFTVGFRDGGTNYDATKTTTYFRAYNFEDGSGTALEYRTPEDLAQSTNFQRLTEGTGADNDQSCVGTLHLFDPSNTTFVKHFICSTHNGHAGNLAESNFIAGYINVTAAIDAVQFKFASGNIDSATIKLYGVT